MRTSVFQVVAVLLVSFLPGCDTDQKAHDPTQVVTPPPPTRAVFHSDPVTDRNSISLVAYIQGTDDLSLGAQGNWIEDETAHPTSVDLLLRIDPGANAELTGTNPGAWCGERVLEVTPTGTPGEWRIQRSAAADDCSCTIDTLAAPDLGGPHLKIHTPGTWRVEVVPASATPACDCDDGCFSGMSFFGGTLIVP